MNKIFVGIAALMALSGSSALAADLPVAPPIYKAPAMVAPPPCLWCGWYVGLNLGGAWDAGTTSGFSGSPATAAFFAAGEFPSALSPKPSGILGGGQLGYNWQVSPIFVLGAEADIQGSGYKGSATFVSAPAGFAPFGTTIEQHSNWFGTVRARAGFLATPTLLLYGTGGLAYGQTEVSTTAVGTGFTLGTCPATFTCVNGSSTSTRAGWTAGGGLEWMFFPRWSAKAEYLYMDLGRQSVTAASTVAAAPCGGACTFTASAPFHENIVRGGVNYHF